MSDAKIRGGSLGELALSGLLAGDSIPVSRNGAGNGHIDIYKLYSLLVPNPTSLFAGMPIHNPTVFNIFNTSFFEGLPRAGAAVGLSDLAAGYTGIPNNIPKFTAYVEGGNTDLAGSQVYTVATGVVETCLTVRSGGASSDALALCGISKPDLTLIIQSIGMFSTKRFAIAASFRIDDALGVYNIGGCANSYSSYWTADPATPLKPCFALQILSGVGTVVLRGTSTNGVALPTTITFDTTKVYDVELLYDGLGTIKGQYRTRTSTFAPSAWTSLGSVSIGGLVVNTLRFTPVMGVKTTTAARRTLEISRLVLAGEI